MALGATIYQFAIDLADQDRSVYESFELRVAQHPSESPAFMLTRVLAFCLEYEEGIALTPGGVSATDEPAVVVRDATGRVTAWIEVGLPSVERLHRGSKLAGRAAVYTHRDVRQLLASLAGAKVHRAPEIPIVALDPATIEEAAAALERRAALVVSVMDRELHLSIGERGFTLPLVEHRIG
jgi:uncharacterized protein YaeQ